MRTPDHSQKGQSFEQLLPREKHLVTLAYKEMLCEDPVIKDLFQQIYPTEKELHEALLVEGEVWRPIPEVTAPQLVEIRHLVGKFLAIVNRVTRGRKRLPGWSRSYLREESHFLQLKNGLSYVDYLHRMSHIARLIVDHFYTHELLDGQPIRVRNAIVRSYPFPEDLAALVIAPSEDLTRRTDLARIGKTGVQLLQCASSLKERIDSLLGLSEEELFLRYLSSRYPFLTPNTNRMVSHFSREVGHRPMFHILKKWILASEHLNDKIYVLAHGLQGGKRFSRKEIAELFSLTYSRIQQVVTETFTCQDDSLMGDPDWMHYSELFDMPFITEHTDLASLIIKREKLQMDFEGFAYLVAITGLCRVEKLDDKVVLLKSGFLEAIDLPLAWKRLMEDYRARNIKEMILPISKYVGNVSWEELSLVTSLFERLILDMEGISLTERGEIRFSPNDVVIEEEFQCILEREGRPMEMREILEAYHASHPKASVTRNRARIILKEDPRFRMLKMRHTFGLSDWKGIYFGSIRDLVGEILAKADQPVHIDKILEEVWVYFPEVTRRSLENSLKLDGKKHFVEVIKRRKGTGYWKVK